MEGAPNPQAQAEPAAPGPAAAPNRNVATGRSKMTEYGATQAAMGTISSYENEPSYPITIHYLNATILFNMFYNMLIPIIWTFARELGHPDPSNANSRTVLRRIAQTVAHAAMQAAYAVCYNKARSNDAFTVLQMPIPSYATETFPAIITALINSLGPIQRGDYPSRRKHIPLLRKTEVDATRQPQTNPSMINLFKEKMQRTRVLFANVELNGGTSSAWWSFFVVPRTQTNTTDEGSPTGQDTLKTMRVFSPVRLGEVENHFILSLVYARAPLIKPGFGAYSASPWYEARDLRRFPGTRPTRDDFPQEVRSTPIFWESTSAFHYEVEAKVVEIDTEVESDEEEHEDEDSAAEASKGKAKATPGRTRATTTAGSSTGISRTRTVRETKRIRTNSVGDAVPVSPTYRPKSPGAPAEDTTHEMVTMYRIVYYYFDNIAILDAHPNDYLNWSYELSQST